MRPSLKILQTSKIGQLFAGLLSLTVVACSSVSPINPGSVRIKSSTRTPPHRMSKEEYPFDSKGNYITDWAAAGERKFGRPAYVKAPPQRGHSSSSSSRSSSSSHTVRKGDTLWGISRKYGKSVSAIKKANNLKSDTIRAGQRLRIP